GEEKDGVREVEALSYDKIDQPLEDEKVLSSDEAHNLKLENEEDDERITQLESTDTDIDIQMSETKDEDTDDVKDVHFLTTIFNRAKEESISTLRIYIVQEGDTVNTIAKQYEIYSLKLLKMNELNENNLEKSQLIYVPIKSKAKK